MAQLEKRHRIMHVAEKLFSDRRLHEVTLDEIARLARVGKGTIYTYFRDKDDLFFQVATGGFDELCEVLAARVARDAPFPEQLLQACEAIDTFFHRRRHLFRMMQTEDARMSLCRGRLHTRWLQRRTKLVEALTVIMSRGRRAGLLREDLADDVLAVFLLGLLRTRARDLNGYERNVGNETLVDMFLHGAADATGISIPAAGEAPDDTEVSP